MHVGHQPRLWPLFQALITGVDLFLGELNTPFNLHTPWGFFVFFFFSSLSPRGLSGLQGGGRVDLWVG